MAGKRSTVGEEYVLDSFIPMEDSEKIENTLAAPEGMNRGGEVGSYRSSYVRGKVEGNRERQVQLASLDVSFGVSFRDYELLLPQENRAGNVATHGGSAMCFYYEHFVCGFRLPLSAFAARVCEGFNVCPMQLTPNSWRMISGFESICRQISALPSFNVFSKLVKAKKLGDWISLYWSATSGFITTVDKEKEGWKSRFFVLRRTAGSAWGFRTSWLFGKPSSIRREVLAGKEVDVWELCRRFRFRWQDVCGPERLNALQLVGSEIPADAMPELLALDAFEREGFMRFIFPTASEPLGSRVAYEGDDSAALVKEFSWKKRGRAASAAGSSSAGESVDTRDVGTGDEGEAPAAGVTVGGERGMPAGASAGASALEKNAPRPLPKPRGSGRSRVKMLAKRSYPSAREGGVPAVEAARGRGIAGRTVEPPLVFREPRLAEAVRGRGPAVEGRGKGHLRPEDTSPSGSPECPVRGCGRGEGASEPAEGTTGIVLLVFKFL